MAFHSILRRGAISAVLRGPVAGQFLPFFRFSTAVSAKPAADVDLVRALESKIECAEKPAEVEGFPFEIQDNPGERTVVLERKYQDETIKVEVDPRYFWMKYRSSGRDDDQNADESNDPPILPLFVSVSKGDGQCLKFRATAYPDGISISSLSFRNSEHSEDPLFENWPGCNDLGEYSWKAFRKYLEIRGINPSMMKFLRKYIYYKHDKDYLMRLKNIKGFVEK